MKKKGNDQDLTKYLICAVCVCAVCVCGVCVSVCACVCVRVCVYSVSLALATDCATQPGRLRRTSCFRH